MSINAFYPQGNTVTFTAAASAPTAVQAPSAGAATNAYRLLNTSTVTVFLGVGSTASGASNNAVTISTTAASIPLLPGTDEILIFPPNSFFTGVTISGTAVIYITPGEGL
jgi:hypothetical protein